MIYNYFEVLYLKIYWIPSGVGHLERPGVVRDPGWAEREGGQTEGWARGLQEPDEWRKYLLTAMMTSTSFP